MAIKRINYQDTLRMRYNMGPDPEDPNKDILRVRSYTRAKYTGSDEHLLSLARALEKLFDAQLVNTYRVMHVELIES